MEENQLPVMPETSKPEKAEYGLYTLLHDVVYILAMITFVFAFAFRLVGVDGDSMYSTLHNGDYLILKNSLICSDYAYGDVVVAATPAFEDGEPIVKRVIATGGQHVDIIYDDEASCGAVYVDGEKLTEDYIREPMNLYYEDEQHVDVPQGSVFLMGDNRNHSTDSRWIGCIEEKYLIGKVLLIAVPGDNSDGWHEGGARQWSRFGTVD